MVNLENIGFTAEENLGKRIFLEGKHWKKLDLSIGKAGEKLGLLRNKACVSWEIKA